MSELEHEARILRAEKLKLRNEVARLSQQTQHWSKIGMFHQRLDVELGNIESTLQRD